MIGVIYIDNKYIQQKFYKCIPQIMLKANYTWATKSLYLEAYNYQTKWNLNKSNIIYKTEHYIYLNQVLNLIYCFFIPF